MQYLDGSMTLFFLSPAGGTWLAGWMAGWMFIYPSTKVGLHQSIHAAHLGIYLQQHCNTKYYSTVGSVCVLT